jgi:hypothetical protein
MGGEVGRFAEVLVVLPRPLEISGCGLVDGTEGRSFRYTIEA